MKARRPQASPLALRSIVGNLVFTADKVTAWFWVPTQRWAFRADSERLNLILENANRVSSLSGRRLHLRVTSRPYPAANWAAGLDANTPNPAPGIRGNTWADHLQATRDHVAKSTMAVKEIYLGVEITDRPNMLAAAADMLLRRPSRPELGQAQKTAAMIARTIAQAGIEGNPATDQEMEWLVRRSLGIGLPAPGSLSPVPDGLWATEDIPELTNGITVFADPFGLTARVTRRDAGGTQTAFVAVQSVGRVDEIEIPDPTQAPWLAELDMLPFPVEWSIRLDVLDGEQAKGDVQKRLLRIRNQQGHYGRHGLDEPLALERQAKQAKSIEDEMSHGGDVRGSRVHGWFRVAVAGATEEECLERARLIRDVYRKRNVTIAHPWGQYALLREYVPGEPLSSTANRRRLPVLYLSGGVAAASSTLGDRRGSYIGHTVGSSRRAVMFDPHYATEIRETSGLVPIVGGLGSGKSLLSALMIYEAARRGVTCVTWDPSGPLAALTKLPEIAAVSRHIDLTSAAPGTLNPYAVVAQPRPADYPDAEALDEARVLAAQDRKGLALDIVTMLLPAALSARARTRLLLTEAIRATKGAPSTSLWMVVEHLERGDADAKEIAAYLRDMAEMPLARLFFPTGNLADVADFTPTLTVLTLPGLILPPAGVPREHWSSSEQLAVPLLHLASWYSSRMIYGRPRSERKLISLDEAHVLGEWSAGRALFKRLGRDSRKWNTCVLAASQNPADVLGMEVSNFISAAFVGRIEDEQVAAEALRLLRVPAGVGYESVLGRLSPRSATGARSGLREFVMRDVDGNVDRVRIDLDHLPHLLAALDTTAAPAKVPLVKEPWLKAEPGLAEQMHELQPWLAVQPVGTGWPAHNGASQ